MVRTVKLLLPFKGSSVVIIMNHHFSSPSFMPICLSQLPRFLFDLANDVLWKRSSPVKPVIVDHFDSPNCSKTKRHRHIWQTALTSGLCISSLHGCLPQSLIAYLGDIRRDELQKLRCRESLLYDGEQVQVWRSDGRGRKCHSLINCQTVKKQYVSVGLRNF